jgi:glycosyltransferase involved in cell wall biosynthesis
VISISPDVTKSFLRVFPSLKDKIIEMENILSPAFVRRRAEEFDATDELAKYGEGIRLLSVGRFCEAKNYDNVPDICHRIISSLSTLLSPLSLKWFLIGYGGYEELIRQKIKDAGMEEHVIILGKRSNPYPYIKECDFYVQPSRYEGKSVTVREAQMLYKPVVVTNYATAPSQIQNGIDGRIVPMDNEGCANGLVDFIKNHQLQQQIVDYLRVNDYGNINEMEKLYTLLDG